MTKLLVRDIKNLKEKKLKAIEALKTLKLEIETIYKKVENYSLDRSDKWYDTDSCSQHYDWEQRIEFKKDNICDITEALETLDFKDIENKTIENEENELVINRLLKKNLEDIEKLTAENKRLIEKAKIIIDESDGYKPYR